mmetsp:Transcript_92843/g.165079  ORF Transcript_92843/g.165079 Transcript_92843/m.165079 type:complete len:319 (-) Transcript_92843:22-978(-)
MTDVHDVPEVCFPTMPVVFNAQKGKHEYAFFADRDPRFLHKLAQLLHKQVVEKGETIIHEGEIGYNMYFLYSGKVEVVVGPQEQRVAVMERGSYFGEMALYGMRKRTATIRAIERSVCLVVKRRVFQFLLHRFPEERKFFENIGRLRVEAITKKKAAGKEATTQGKPMDRFKDLGVQGSKEDSNPEVAGVRKLLQTSTTPEPGEVEDSQQQPFEHPLDSPRKHARRRSQKPAPLFSQTFRDWSKNKEEESPRAGLGESPRAGATLLPEVGSLTSRDGDVPCGVYRHKKYAGVLGLEKELRRQVGQHGRRRQHSHAVDY